MSPEDVDIWFRVNNIIPEKMDLYYDFSFSLYYLILDTYLGDEKSNETKVILTDEDNVKHFEWCWDKTIDNFKKEEITFNRKGEHYEYFLSFFVEIFYNQKENKINYAFIDDYHDYYFTILNKAILKEKLTINYNNRSFALENDNLIYICMLSKKF